MAHRPPLAWRLAALLLTGLAGTPVCGGAEPLTLAPTTEERALAEQVLPGLTTGAITASSRTFANTRALPHGARGRFLLHRVDVGPANPEGEAMAVVWLEREDRRVPNALYCPDCVRIAIPVLVLAEEQALLAAAKHPLGVTGASTAQPTLPQSLGSHVLHRLERVNRNRGKVTQRTMFFIQRGRLLLEAGTLTTAGGNEGSCGRLECLSEGGRLLGPRDQCATVWRFRSSLKATENTIKVSEELTQGTRPGFKIRVSKRKITYLLGRGMLRAKRHSLLREFSK